jgi:hypothetical protein
MITYRNRVEGVNIKLGNPMTECHGLDIDKKSHPRLLLTEWLRTHSRVVVDLQHLDSKVTGSVIESY